jgi:hypothetical protein
VDIGVWIQTWTVFNQVASPTLMFFVTQWQNPAAIPYFTLSPWSASPYVQRNNCYNYAGNTITNTRAQPGYYSTGWWCGADSDYPDCMIPSMIGELTEYDGFVPATPVPSQGNIDAVCPAGMDKMLLLIWPYTDFHFIRQDVTGYWSHKRGQNFSSWIDFCGHDIPSPLLGCFGQYVWNGGFFCAPHSSPNPGATGSTIR